MSLPSLEDISDHPFSRASAPRRPAPDGEAPGSPGSRTFSSLGPRAKALSGAAILLGTLLAGVELARITGPTPAAAPATAQPAARPAPAGPADEAIRMLRSKGNSLLPLPDVDGLKQYLVIHDGITPQPVFITPSGKFIILGMANDLQGRPVTMEAVAALISQQGGQVPSPAHSAVPAEAGPQEMPAPPQDRLDMQSSALTPAAPAAQPALKSTFQTISPAIMTRIEAGNWIPFGRSGAPILYMAADPSCPWCQKTWPMLAPLIDQGKIQVRLLMVGLVNHQTSFNRAVAIMMSDHQQQSWTEDMSGTPPAQVPIYRLDNADEIPQRVESEAKRTGDAKSKVRTTLNAEAAILTNHDLLAGKNGIGVQFTPTFFFRSDADHAPIRFDSEPDQPTMTAILAKMGVS